RQRAILGRGGGVVEPRDRQWADSDHAARSLAAWRLSPTAKAVHHDLYHAGDRHGGRDDAAEKDRLTEPKVSGGEHAEPAVRQYAVPKRLAQRLPHSAPK